MCSRISCDINLWTICFSAIYFCTCIMVYCSNFHCHHTKKIPFYGKVVPNGLKKIISTSFIFLVLFFSSQVVLSSFNNIIKSHHDYDDNIAKIILTLNTTFDIDIESYVEDNMSTLDFKAIAGELFNAISTILSSALMILLFVVFIFIEETQFNKKLQKIFIKTKRKIQFINGNTFKN